GKPDRPAGKEPGYEVLAVSEPGHRCPARAGHAGRAGHAAGLHRRGAGHGRGRGAGGLRSADGGFGRDHRAGARRAAAADRWARRGAARAGRRVRDHRLPGPGRRAQVGGGHAGGQGLFGRGPRDRRYRGRTHRERALRPDLEELLRRCWWGAMAEVARATGRLDVAEDSVQDACVVVVQQWAAGRVPRDPQAWLTGVARHKALDRLRRESRRPAKEATGAAEAIGPARSADEDLWLIYLCCHPALSPEARIALTLRAVGGLTTAEIAAAFLVPEATMAKRLTRAKNKIRDAGLALAMPRTELLQTRTADVLRVVYLIFSEGHQASSGDDLLRSDLCVAGVNLARGLAARLPRDPEVLGLLALLLLTDARRAARTDDAGDLVLLE